MARVRASRPRPAGLMVRILTVASVLGIPCSLNAQTFDERFERIKAEASQRELYALLWDLPKGGDLHNHLGGTGSPATWFDVASDPEHIGARSDYDSVDSAGSRRSDDMAAGKRAGAPFRVLGRSGVPPTHEPGHRRR